MGLVQGVEHPRPELHTGFLGQLDPLGDQEIDSRIGRTAKASVPRVTGPDSACRCPLELPGTQRSCPCLGFLSSPRLVLLITGEACLRSPISVGGTRSSRSRASVRDWRNDGFGRKTLSIIWVRDLSTGQHGSPQPGGGDEFTENCLGGIGIQSQLHSKPSTRSVFRRAGIRYSMPTKMQCVRRRPGLATWAGTLMESWIG